MRNISFVIIMFLVALVSCTKKNEVHPEIGDGNDEIVTVGIDKVHIKYIRNDNASLQKVMFNYSLVDEQQFDVAEMTKKSDCFELTLNDLESDALYRYYYEVFPYSGNAYQTSQKAFQTQANDAPSPPIVGLPAVATMEVTEITSTTAVCGGEVTDDGGSSVTARGVCWSTSENPTINDTHTTEGSGIGVFVSSLRGLSSNTTYHVRAYATNEAGTAYGSDREFATLLGGGGGEVPIGAINGLFSVSSDQQVYFSQGNLQYQASTDTWKFAENQYDYIGNSNSNSSSTYSGWIDLFGWGTSGYHDANDPYNVYYQPWSTAPLDGYGPTSYMPDPNLTGTSAAYDWGVYNPISNGGNTANQWRTLTEAEWVYVFNTRTTTSGILYAMAIVNNVNGVILLPDDWSSSTYGLNHTNSNSASFSSNTISVSRWTILESAGAVFLPAAGQRIGTAVLDAGNCGNYCSSSCSAYSNVYRVYFSDSYLIYGSCARYYGLGVRLVYDANK